LRGRSFYHTAKIEHLRPKGLFHNPAFSQVVTAIANRTIFVSSQVSIDENGGVVGATELAAQTTQVMHNVGLALAAAGATYSDVVKLTNAIEP
jgi:enamine deaminase RidA (YjgF/YER057c/UK114 family)